MQRLSFPFQKEKSSLFGNVYRPMAQVHFWSFRRHLWDTIALIVDSGADYTLLPRYFARFLGVNLKHDCERHPTSGIGGTEEVFLFRKMPIKIGKWENKIPVGFLDHNEVPPLLGRQDCLEKIGVVLHKRKTILVL